MICLHVCGQLQAGSYALPGNVSSQFVSGLLFALPLLAEDSVLTVTGHAAVGAVRRHDGAGAARGRDPL